MCVCIYIHNIHIYGLRFDNVTCMTESVIMPWFGKACFFLIYPIILYLLSPQPMRLQQRIINWFVLKKMFLFHVIFYAKGSFKKFCACFSFICYLSICCVRTLFFIDAVCKVKTHVFSPFMLCSLLLKDRACIFLCEIFVSKNGKGLFILQNK